MSTYGISDLQNAKIIEFIAKHEICGIVAPTGSGKSTTMVQKIYDEGATVFVSEPTIPSAQGLYRYMGGVLGREKVGYAAEGDVQYNSSTPIVYCTSGHLRRKMLSYFVNGEIKSGAIDFCSVIVLDEAHNGSIDNDAIIEMWIEAGKKGAVVPRLILASATLTKENAVVRDLPIFEIKTKSFPIALEYANTNYTPESRNIYSDMAITIIMKHSMIPVELGTASKWLVFCPGSSEVENVCSVLREAELDGVKILPVYSNLPGDEIYKIFDKAELNTRTIIVSTNIAETSITIDGLDGVFDSMVEKVGETSSSGGFRLAVKNISKSSAKQRMGRTGRTKPGFCHRMCTKDLYENLVEQRQPEITRVPITNLVIEFLNVGLDPEKLFGERVSKKKMQDTLQDLADLNMINEAGNVTEIGNFATLFPLYVKNSALIYNWMNLHKNGDPEQKYPVYPIVVLACLIDSYGPSYYFYPRKLESQTFAEYEDSKKNHYEKYFEQYSSENDLKTLLKMWNDMMQELKTLYPDNDIVLKWNQEHSFNNKKINEVIKVVRQCCNLVLSYTKAKEPLSIGPFSEDNVLRVASKVMINVYKNNIFENSKDGIYLSKLYNKYFRIDRKQALNMNNKYKYPRIIALRTAEISGSGKYTSNVISLSFPI